MCRLPASRGHPRLCPRCAESAILSTPSGFVYDMRAISERYVDANGHDVVDILSEEDYYRLMYVGLGAEAAPWAAHLVWVE